MLSTYFITLVLCTFICPFGSLVAASTILPTAVGNSSQALPTSTPITENIALSSAIQIEGSVSSKLEQLTSTAAIPLPANFTQFPQYDAVHQLAPALPVFQGGIKYPETPDTVADFVSSSNLSNSSNTRRSPTRRQSSMRILIVGDSITQGQQGDYTWRYRIWQWLKQSSVTFQMVGPYKGTHSPPPVGPPQPPALYGSVADTSFTTDGGYAAGIDTAFLADSNHFAVWGRAAAVDKDLIQGVMQQNNADLMLLMLGFNDLGWFYSDTAGTLASIQSLITNARSVNPNLKVAVANIPHRTHIGGRDDLVQNTNSYNEQLPGLLSKMSTDQSPLHVVDIAGNYACSDSWCPGGYDGLHPNAWGEYQIASAFSKALVNDFKIGSSPLAVPAQSDASLVRDLPVPSNIRAFSSPQGVTVTWDAVYGAYSYDVQATMNGQPVIWSAGTVPNNRWDTQWPLDGWTYTVLVRASAGNDIKGAWTSPVSAVAKPELPPPPQNVHVQPTGNGVTITWDPPNGPFTDSIVEYNIMYWDWEPSHCQFLSGAAFKSSPAVINNLTPGRNYAIFLVTWNQNGQGLPLGSFNVVPGAGTPPVPSGLQVQTNDPTTVHLTWSGSNSAGGYHVWYRNINTPGSELQLIGNVTITDSNCNDQYFLFPGTWNYAFAVSAFNGDEESQKGPEVIAPSPASGITEGSPGPTCPPNPQWCPTGGGISIPPVGNGPTTTVVGGTTSTITSKVTTVVGGTTTVIGGTTTVIGGTTSTQTSLVTTVVGGITSVVGNSGTTVIGGTTTIVSGTTTVIGGTTVVGGSTSVLGGTTTVVGGTTTIIGGATTIVGGSTILPPGPVITGLPTVTNGRCTGSDCVNGHCIGLLCASFGCSGGDCHNGICTGLDCIAFGCIGPNCIDGICKGLGCLSAGCLGSDCEGGGGGGGGTGHCFGLKCISLGCIGLNCGSGGICLGSQCTKRSCSGPDCHNGVCAGPSCNPSGGEIGGSPDAPDDGEETKTCSTSSKFATCTTSFMVVTSVFPDRDSTTTSTSTTSTCYTVTACTGSATTVSTTTQTATTIERLCDRNGCGNACPTPRKRNTGVIPTAVPQLDDSGDYEIVSGSLNSTHSAMVKRDIPLDGTGDWSQWYHDLRVSSDTIIIDNYAETAGTEASWVRVKWEDKPINILVKDLYGCFVVIATSQLGAFVGHFWEAQSIANSAGFVRDVLGTLQANFDRNSDTSKEYFGPSTRFYIMAATRTGTDGPVPEALEYLSKTHPAGARYPDAVKDIKDFLSTYSDDIVTFIYLKQLDDNTREGDNAFGKAAVRFDPAQRTFPGTGFLPGTALVKTVLQAYVGEDRFWPYQQFDIWRVNANGGATNNAVQIRAGGTLDPCALGLGVVASSQPVPVGSVTTDVAAEPFQIVESNGHVLDDGCVFRGRGYAPDRRSGLIAGQLTCNSGVVRDCFRPVDNQATTCGNGPLSGCGQLGINCPKYWQLIGSCRI